MNKLLKLKEWLTLDEAVLELSKVINEPVAIADLYRFALDGHLTLSVIFANTACALKGQWLKTDDIANKSAYQMALEYGAPGISEKCPEPNEMFVSGDDWISWEDNIDPITGVWDLTMKGDEALDVKDSYHKLTSGVSVKRVYNNGLLMQQGDLVCQLYNRLNSEQSDAEEIYNKIFPPHEVVVLDTGELIEKKHCGTGNLQGIDHTYYMFFNKIQKIVGMYFVPCSSLDEQNYVFVIRTKEMTRFIQSLGGTPQEIKPSAQKAYTKNNDKRTYNKVKTQNKYLAWQREAIKLKKKHPNKSKTWIAVQVARLPIAEGKSADTIRKNIKI